jgi:hypothetical protein
LSQKFLAAHRLSQFGRATPSNSDPSYLVPEGLIDLDDVVDWGFADEWSNCANCHVVLRTSPDCYFWKPQYWDDPAFGLTCINCLDHAVYIDHHIGNANSAVNTELVDLEEYSWHKVDITFQNGWHEHMNDDPKRVMAILEDEGIDSLFTYEPSQFYTSFNVWVRENRVEETDTVLRLRMAETRLPYSQSEELSKALKGQPSEVDVQMYTLNEEGVLEDQNGNTLDIGG